MTGLPITIVKEPDDLQLVQSSGTTASLEVGSVTHPLNPGENDSIGARDFGAICDGIVDDTAALQAALDVGRTLYIPDAVTCKITGVLTVSRDGTGIVGAGPSSVLSSTSNSDHMISVNAGVNRVNISGLKLTRTVIPVAGSGINFAGNTETTSVSNIYVDNQFNGMTLRTTNFSTVSDIQSWNNQADGIAIVDTVSSATMQWYIDNVISGQNGIRGLIASTGNGLHSATLGNWTRIYTFGNASFGIAIAGQVTAPINGVRLSDAFLGQDGNSELYFDTFGGLHNVSNVFCELAGTGVTGVNLATAASHVGRGVEVTANNTDVRIVNCFSNGNSQAGYKLEATVENNLTASRASNNGSFGLILANGLTSIVNGNKFTGNVSGPFSITANALSVTASGNSPPVYAYTDAVLSGDTTLNNTGQYFDGPSVTLGAGTWMITAAVTVLDTGGAGQFFAKLWDGASIVIASGGLTTSAVNVASRMTLSGVIACANGTVVKVSVRDSSATTGKIAFNNSGNSKDSNITAIRIG